MAEIETKSLFPDTVGLAYSIFTSGVVSNLLNLMEVCLVDFVRIGWVAAILPIVIALILTPCSKLNTFRELVMGFSKRGKTMQKSKNVSDCSCL